MTLLDGWWSCVLFPAPDQRNLQSFPPSFPRKVPPLQFYSLLSRLILSLFFRGSAGLRLSFPLLSSVLLRSLVPCPFPRTLFSGFFILRCPPDFPTFFSQTISFAALLVSYFFEFQFLRFLKLFLALLPHVFPRFFLNFFPPCPGSPP